MVCSSVNRTDPVKNGESTSDKETAVDIQLIMGLLSSALELQYHCALSDCKIIAVCVTFPLLDVVQDVVATLFDERGRVVSSSCHAVPHGRSVD